MTHQERKNGSETFCGADFALLEFWQWSSSDLLNNALRGKLAEFLVAKAIGAADGIRTEWDAVDVISPSGIRIEVKCAAYVQSWTQPRPSTISFDIAPKQARDAQTNTTSPEAIRSADVYVFALLKEQDEAKADHLDLAQPGSRVPGNCRTSRKNWQARKKAGSCIEKTQSK